jgi:histidinol-phosphate aminotransferase
MKNSHYTMSTTLTHHNAVPYSMSLRPTVEHLVPYTPGESLQTFSQRTGIPVERVVKLNANESPYGPVPAALEALRSHDWYNQYPDTQAFLLKEALSRYTGLDTRHIVPGHGSMEVIRLLWSLLLSPGDEIICCSPTFSLYTSVASECRARIHNVPRQPDHEIDLAAILDALTPVTRMIILCSPNNPTGNLLAEEDLLALLKTGRMIMVDEAYVEFSQRPTGYAHLVPYYPNLTLIRTFSKWAGLAGLRIGYGLFPQWIMKHVQLAHYPFAVNVAGHLAAIATLTHLDEAQEHVQHLIDERKRLFHLLARQPYLAPVASEGNFILARLIDERINLHQLQQAMEADGILLRYFPHLGNHDYVRITVGRPEHTDRIQAVLEQAGV